MVTFISAVIFGVLLQIVGTPELITLFSPLIVYVSTLLVTYFLPTIERKIPGWLVLSFVVPGLSLLLTVLLPATAVGFWPQFLYGLLAVFINEVIDKLKKAFGSQMSK